MTRLTLVNPTKEILTARVQQLYEYANSHGLDGGSCLGNHTSFSQDLEALERMLTTSEITGTRM